MIVVYEYKITVKLISSIDRESLIDNLIRVRLGSLRHVVLGYILGPIIENNFRTGVIAAKGNVFGFVHYPIAMTLLVISAIMIAVPEYKRQKARRTAEAGPQ